MSDLIWKVLTFIPALPALTVVIGAAVHLRRSRRGRPKTKPPARPSAPSARSFAPAAAPPPDDPMLCDPVVSDVSGISLPGCRIPPQEEKSRPGIVVKTAMVAAGVSMFVYGLNDDDPWLDD